MCSRCTYEEKNSQKTVKKQQSELKPLATFISLEISTLLSLYFIRYDFVILSVCLSVWSPWYNCTGWLGVKHQLTYCLSVRPSARPSVCLSVCLSLFLSLYLLKIQIRICLTIAEFVRCDVLDNNRFLFCFWVVFYFAPVICYLFDVLGVAVFDRQGQIFKKIK